MSLCCCSMDAEGPTVCEKITPKASKPYRCGECRAVINPGETYERFKGLWDGEWSTFVTCAGCADVRQNVAPCEPYPELWEHFSAWADDIGPGHLDRLSPAGLEKLQAMLDKLNGEEAPNA
jgi:hypothetical protein